MRERNDLNFMIGDETIRLLDIYMAKYKILRKSICYRLIISKGLYKYRDDIEKYKKETPVDYDY